ncbi:MAG: hypothetical protein IJN12_03565 [Clostridia bacterium]|nr:hypothetical protein [Clostridia bacterium]
MKKWIDLSTIGGTGPEKGIILKDQELDGICRITLETYKDHRAITCGLYGNMLLTVYRSTARAEATYEELKSELGRFIALNYDNNEEVSAVFYDYLFHKYYLEGDVPFWDNAL